MKKINETKRILTEWRKNFISESYYDEYDDEYDEYKKSGLPSHLRSNQTATQAMTDAEVEELSGFDAAARAYDGYEDSYEDGYEDGYGYEDDGQVTFRVNTEFYGDDLVYGIVNKNGKAIKIVYGPRYLDEKEHGRIEIVGMEQICEVLDDLGVESVVDTEEDRIPYDEWREYNC